MRRFLSQKPAGGQPLFDVAVYPPGIPVLYPGEEITKEIQDYLLNELEGKPRSRNRAGGWGPLDSMW